MHCYNCYGVTLIGWKGKLLLFMPHDLLALREYLGVANALVRLGHNITRGPRTIMKIWNIVIHTGYASVPMPVLQKNYLKYIRIHKK